MRKPTVGVVGLGYVGLPLVRTITRKGMRVVGFDIDETKVGRLNRNDSYIRSVPSSTIRKLRRQGKFSATSDFGRIPEVDAILICVPTPLEPSGRPDLRFVRETAKTVGRNLRKGQLVVLESTTYPGTTREIMLPAMERRNRRCGRDFFLAYSPEREDPGNKKFPMEKIPKIVGALDAKSLRAAAALYRRFVPQVVEVSSAETAESAKLLENIYRCVNIALVNELKMCFQRMDIDVWEVIRAAATKPFGFQAFFPGPGMGGHCIPQDRYRRSSMPARSFATRRRSPVDATSRSSFSQGVRTTGTTRCKKTSTSSPRPAVTGYADTAPPVRCRTFRISPSARFLGTWIHRPTSSRGSRSRPRSAANTAANP